MRAGGEAAALDAEFAEELEHFRMAREAQPRLEELEELADEWERYADDHFRLADAVEHRRAASGGPRDVYRLKREQRALANVLGARVMAHQRRRDAVLEAFAATARRRLPAASNESPSELRRRAAAYLDTADDWRCAVDLTRGADQELRGRADGRPLDLAMFFVCLWAIERGVGPRDLARRFVAAGELPDIDEANPDAEQDPVIVWEVRFKARMRDARARVKMRSGE